MQAMHDMTRGPVRGHVLRMTGFLLVVQVVQTLYSLIDIYWVGRLGAAAVAAVSISSHLMFLVIALTQMLGVGTVALVSQAAGRKSGAEVQLLFNQAQALSMVVAVLFLAMGLLLQETYITAVGSDRETVALARQFMVWFMPAMALQFTMVGIASALRGIGDMRPGMIASTGSLLLNIVLAPILIFGWGTGRPLGVAGAGLATFVATLAPIIGLTLYLRREATFLRLDFTQWRPGFRAWGRMLGIGLPAGGEFIVMAIVLGLIYFVIRPFGAEAQAGFGIGLRLMQAFFAPVVCIGFAAAAVVGQNYGAGRHDRVGETFRESLKLAAGCMVLLTILCQVAPDAILRAFSDDPGVVRVGAQYLRYISWNFLAAAVIFVGGGLFQGLGNTWPSLAASASRLVLFVVPVVWLSRQTGFSLAQVWITSVISVTLQMVFLLLLLRRVFRQRLAPSGPSVLAVDPAP